MLVGALFGVWDFLDWVVAGVSSEDMLELWDGGSSFAWTYGHLTNMVDAWLNVRFQALPPHPLISDANFRIGGNGRTSDWPAIQREVAIVRDAARLYLQPLMDADLDLVIPYDGSVVAFRRDGLSLRYAVLHSTTHHYYHIGEIATKRQRLGHVLGDYPIPTPSGISVTHESVK